MLSTNGTMVAGVNAVPQGTQDDFAIGFAPLDLDTVYGRAIGPENGAVVMMSGTVRQATQGREVAYLEYQAYNPMAIAVFQTIAQQIREQWPTITRIVIHHRTGKLTIGEISVLVAIGCPHRREAFAAAQYAMDTLKHQAPIWKKEHWQDGSSTWVSLAECEALHGQPGSPDVAD